MKKAVYRIYQAIVLGQRICIFGDYDADGMTSSALLYRALCFLKGNVSVRVPTRMEGYGLTPEAVERMAEENPALIITVDNGSNSHAALAAAVVKGIDVIVTDHHEITGELLDAMPLSIRNDKMIPILAPTCAELGWPLKLSKRCLPCVKISIGINTLGSIWSW